MSDNISSENVEVRLAEIEKAASKRWDSVVADLIQVGQAINQDLLTSEPEQLTRLNGLTKRYAQMADSIVDRLQESCEVHLEACEDETEPLDEERFDHELGQARQALAQIVELAPERRSQPEIEDLELRLVALTDRWTSRQRLRDLRGEAEKLWQRAERLERELAPADQVVDLCQQALNRLSAALQTSSGWGPAERDDLLILQSQARRRYDDMRARHQIPITKQAGDQLVALILDFAERARRSPSELVTYFVSAEPDAQPQAMEVTRALEIAKERLVLLFWSDKITQYIRAADDELGAHRPRAATAALREWESLPGLHDNRVGVSFPENLRIQIDNTVGRIKPELDALDRAETAALTAMTVIQSDPLEAYRLWEEGRDAYLHLPDLGPLRDEIVQAASEELGRLLDQAEDRLKQEEWGLCESRLQRSNQLLDLDATLRARFQDQHDSLKHIYERVCPVVPGQRDRLQLEGERDHLEDLRRDYENSYWEKWTGLQRRLDQLQARSHFQAIRQEADELCRPDAALAALESLHRDCQQLIAHPPKGLSERDRDELTGVQSKLRAWMGFALARDELGKVRSDGDTESDAEWAMAPDLAAVRDELQEARRDRGASQAVREQNLDARLRELEGNDERVVTILEEARDLVSARTLEGADAALTRIRFWLRRATSHRTALLDLQRDTQLVLYEQTESEAHRLLARARVDWYASLDTLTIDRLRKQAKRPPHEASGPGDSGSLEDVTAGPVAIARAHKLEAQAERGSVKWDDVKRRWEAAAALCQDDEALRAYCTQRAQQAHKRNEFLQARGTADPEQARRILRALCEDSWLREDWQVWFRYGSHCLHSARELLRGTRTGDPEGELAQHLAQSREALTRANHIARASPTAGDDEAQTSSALSELDAWEALARAKQEIRFALESSGDRLTVAACEAAVARHQEAVEALGTGEPGQLHRTFWHAQQREAHNRLDAQIAQSADELERMDAWLAKSLLSSGDETIKRRLAEISMGAFQRLRNTVEDVVFDATAGHFLQRHAVQAKGTVVEDKDVAGLQLAETRRLLGETGTLRTALSLLSGRLRDTSLSPGSLDGLQKSLEDWEAQLVQFQRATEQAARLAHDGLGVPAQFKVAHYILRQGGTTSPDHLQVPPTFRDMAHPTYRWCQGHVRELEERRQKQEDLRRRIEWCLGYEQVTRPEELPGDLRGRADRELVEDLREKLQRPVHRVFPVEEALRLIRQMQREEPYDETRLQESILYEDPEHGRTHESLTVIHDVISAKVIQVQALRGWLGQFTVGTSKATGECPGVVDWTTEKQQIEQFRDSGPRGLGAAAQWCRNARLGDDNGIHAGLWSLTRACKALTRVAMLDHLQGAGDTGPGAGTVLCAAAQRIDGERHDLRELFDRQAREALELEDETKGRAERYEGAWDRFVRAFHGLMEVRNRPGSSRRWQEFSAAADAFNGICPGYSEFQRMLNQVYQEKGLDHPCRRGGVR